MTNAAEGPALRWQVLVDWAGRGLWGSAANANGDVSDDVLALRWQWGRRGRPAPEFASPATLELSLRNRDGRYTPGNAASPLAGLVTPGRAVWLRAAYLYDDMASSAGAGSEMPAPSGMPSGSGSESESESGSGSEMLAGRAASGAVRAVWQQRAGADFTLQGGVASVAAVPSGRPADAIVTLDTGDPLATLLVRYRRGSSGRGGFVLRCAAAGDCLRLRFGSRHTILERVAGGRATRLAAGVPLAAGQWHELEIVQRDAGSVRVFATNLDAAGTVRREILADDDIVGAPVSGQHGLWNRFRNAADRWGGFQAGRSLFCGQIVNIEPDFPDAGQCRIRAVDGMQRLDEVRLWRGLPSGAAAAGQIAAAILGWAGLTAADYAVDGGRTLRSGGPRSVWDITAGTALRRLQREENGLLYADGLGRVCLEGNAVRAAVRAHADPATLARFAIGDTAGGAGAGAYAGGIVRDDGGAAMEDVVTFRYHRPADQGRQTVWSLNETLAAPAGGELRLLAASDRWEAVSEVAAPVGGVDYAATDDEAGAGADVTANITVSVLSEAASGVSGRGRQLLIRNGGAQTAYLQRLRLTAAHCWQSDNATACRAASAGAGASAAAPGRVVRCQYADHYGAAQGAAAARLAEYSRRRAGLELTLPLQHGANIAAAVEGRISDVIAGTGAGIAGVWLLEGMAVDAAGGGAGEARWWLTGV